MFIIIKQEGYDGPKLPIEVNLVKTCAMYGLIIKINGKKILHANMKIYLVYLDIKRLPFVFLVSILFSS